MAGKRVYLLLLPGGILVFRDIFFDFRRSTKYFYGVVFMNDFNNQLAAEIAFPNMNLYPLNSMTPTLDEDGVISLLIIGEEELIQDIRKDKDGQVNLQISCYLESNKLGLGQDIVIRIEFFYPSGTPSFETVIYGHLLHKQSKFVHALEKAKCFAMFVADANRKVFKVMSILWDFEVHRSILEPFLSS